MTSLRLVHALYESMESGGWASLDDGTGSAKLGIGA
jgi:hypothetical protein